MKRISKLIMLLLLISGGLTTAQTQTNRTSEQTKEEQFLHQQRLKKASMFINNAKYILMGIPKKREAFVANDGKTYTAYLFEVSEVFRGNIKKETIEIVELGGYIEPTYQMPEPTNSDVPTREINVPSSGYFYGSLLVFNNTTAIVFCNETSTVKHYTEVSTHLNLSNHITFGNALRRTTTGLGEHGEFDEIGFKTLDDFWEFFTAHKKLKNIEKYKKSGKSGVLKFKNGTVQ